MKYVATPSWRWKRSPVFICRQYHSRTSSMWSARRRARSNFSRSFTPLTVDDGASCTYLYSPLTLSCHMHSHDAVGSHTTLAHLCPGGGGGTLTPREMLMVTSSGRTRFLSMPRRGCSPRPRKRPGGSMRKLETFSLRPSMKQYLNRLWIASCSSLSLAFSSFDIAFFASRFLQWSSQMASKLIMLRSLIGCSPRFDSTFRNSMKKFWRKIGCV
mmetsp:Transcript_44647/g.137797  ORF Transcript_44647/g.137797 Transcript_44647/m.137797 type:complete len:214 (+) Transcript_44647:1100-1741(+)